MFHFAEFYSGESEFYAVIAAVVFIDRESSCLGKVCFCRVCAVTAGIVFSYDETDRLVSHTFFTIFETVELGKVDWLAGFDCCLCCEGKNILVFF